MKLAGKSSAFPRGDFASWVSVMTRRNQKGSLPLRQAVLQENWHNVPKTHADRMWMTC